MAAQDDEEERLRTVALRNAQSILAARQRAEEALRHQSEWLRVTLASIGDAVISTDAEGRVTFLNGVAEALTGWTEAEAVGRPLPEVFNIINETTRQTVENPALCALREGTIVGLTRGATRGSVLTTWRFWVRSIRPSLRAPAPGVKRRAAAWLARRGRLPEDARRGCGRSHRRGARAL